MKAGIHSLMLLAIVPVFAYAQIPERLLCSNPLDAGPLRKPEHNVNESLQPAMCFAGSTGASCDGSETHGIGTCKRV